jgi:hypothetical protein
MSACQQITPWGGSSVGPGLFERPAAAANIWRIFGYQTNLSVDYDMKLSYRFVSLAHGGRVLETILNAERGVASCGGGS